MLGYTRALNRALLKSAGKNHLASSFLNLKHLHRLYSYKVQSSDTLKKLFNDKSYYNRFNKVAKDKNTGLFSNKLLQSPEGLYQFYKLYLYKCQHLLRIIHQDQSDDADTKFITRIDNISNNLCKVIDLCEMIRSLHPNEKFIVMADRIYNEMFEFMNILNTDVVLYNNLNRVMRNKDSLKLTEEQAIVGKILLDDFNKSGLFMNDEAVKNKFIELSSDISQLGQNIIISEQEPPFENHNEMWKVSLEKLKNSLPAAIYSNLPIKKTEFLLKNKEFVDISKNNLYVLYQINKFSSDEQLRKQSWIYMNMSSEEQVGKVSKLLELRLKLANLMKEKTHNSYQLKNKLMKNSEHVELLLKNLVKDYRQEALNELSLTKPGKLEAYDREFYKTKSTEINRVPQLKLNVGAVFSELFHLLSTIYSLDFVVTPLYKSETWHEDVRKVEIYDAETKKLKAFLYLDLYHRDLKNHSASHFTVTTSKKLNDQEIVYENEDINATCVISDSRQIPIIVLNTSLYNPLCISENDMETIFHEMGHAMHSVLSLTELQNCSGTRCVSDIVELPSILMELFAKDPRVLRKVIDNPDIELPKDYFKATEMIQQTKLALLDYRFHEIDNVKDLQPDNLLKIYQQTEIDVGVMPDVYTNWYGRFTHLVGYGSSYYTYSLDRIIANKIYNKLFASDPYSRESGDILKNKFLKYGGSRSPWECLADVFNNQDLAKGDTKAVEYITDTKSDD
ncbi:metalloendopeptidase [Hanseniaspora uvarum]|nr:metalloendopeptidase [Hanseniaspora uvarum]